MTDPNPIYFIVEDSPESVSGTRDGTRDIGGSFGPTRTSRNDPRQRVAVSSAHLNGQMQSLIAAVNQMFSKPPQLPNPDIELDEIELTVEVNAQGQLSILGTGGSAGGRGAITLRFKRVE